MQVDQDYNLNIFSLNNDNAVIDGALSYMDVNVNEMGVTFQE